MVSQIIQRQNREVKMSNGFLDDLPELNLPARRRKKKTPEPKDQDKVVRYTRLRCPKCGSSQVPVQHTNSEVNGIIVRRHKCLGCDLTFKSIESIQPG